MTHQRAIVHNFFLLNIQAQEKIFIGKVVTLAKTKTILPKKYQFCSHNMYMSHRRSPVDHFFPFNVQVLEKNLKGNSCSISEN